LAGAGLCRQVKDRVDAIESALEIFPATEIAAQEFRTVSRYVPSVAVNLRRQIIEQANLMPRFDGEARHMRADEAGAAGYENV
jgi:hypothetical protein